VRDGEQYNVAIDDLMALAFGPGTAAPLGPRPRGSEHGRAALDESAVAELRALRAEGWSYRALAEEYGVSRAAAYYAATGATWGHVAPGLGGAGAAESDAPDPDECPEIAGFPGYRIGPNRVVWSRRGRRERPGSPTPLWRPLRMILRTGHATAVGLRRDGKGHWRTIDALMRLAFGAEWRPETGRPPGPPIGRPRNGGGPKLDADDVAEMRRLREAGWGYKVLCGRYGVSKSTLHAALTGATWKHVGPWIP